MPAATGEDPLATAAAADGVVVHKFVRYRELIKNGAGTIPEVLEACQAADADLYVLAFVTLFVPLDLFGDKEAIVYHPSLLPVPTSAPPTHPPTHPPPQLDSQGDL